MLYYYSLSYAKKQLFPHVSNVKLKTRSVTDALLFILCHSIVPFCTTEHYIGT